jgi:hypothetical protein
MLNILILGVYERFAKQNFGFNWSVYVLDLIVLNFIMSIISML